MNREEAEQLAQELLKPPLWHITVKTPFALYLMEFEHFRQERLKHGI